ncbi:MAG: hypothetical protein R3330_00985, partial [Saprospiraceae bacterium]|nr:hypothetical protein [Saprospiraceae bacterium]
IPANTAAIRFIGVPSNSIIYGTIWESYLDGSATGANIYNNIVLQHSTGFTIWKSNASNTDCLVQNNAFASNYSNYYISNCTFRNNIVAASAFQIYDCVFQHNLFVDDDVFVDDMTVDSLGNGNIDSVDIATVWDLTNPSPDGKYQLIGTPATNPAFNAGINGEDCGPYQGNSAYRLSGIVQIPTIYQMLVPLVGDTTNMLNVTIKAKSND